jgi:hypothetical protein
MNQVIVNRDTEYRNAKQEISVSQRRRLERRTKKKARESHAVGFSQISQFGQCHSYVLAAACLWPDRVLSSPLDWRNWENLQEYNNVK